MPANNVGRIRALRGVTCLLTSVPILQLKSHQCIPRQNIPPHPRLTAHVTDHQGSSVVLDRGIIIHKHLKVDQLADVSTHIYIYI